MLDVHVLVLPGLPEEWIEQRRASIAAAVRAAGYPVVVHEVEGIPKHLGKSRKKGYSFGAMPYVTHVDHDDYVTEDAFRVLREHLLSGVDCVTTGETILYESGIERKAPESKHHLAVFKREITIASPLDRMKHFPDQLLLTRCTSVHVPECVYVHRVYKNSASRIERGKDSAGVREEGKIVSNPSLLSVELMTTNQIEDEIEGWLHG